MPCGELTPRQCKVRDALARKLEKQEGFKGNPWAVATSIVQKRKEAKHGQ